MSTPVITTVPAPLSSATSVSGGPVAPKDRTVLAQAVTGEKDPAPATDKPTDPQVVVVPPESSTKPEQESCDDKKKKSASDKQAEEDENCPAAVLAQDTTNPLWVLAALPLLGLGGGSDSHNAFTIASSDLKPAGGLLTSANQDIHFDFDKISDRLLTIYRHSEDTPSGKVLCIEIDDGLKFVEFDGVVREVMFEGDYLSSFGFERDGDHFNFKVQTGGDGDDMVVGDVDSDADIRGGDGDDILFATPAGNVLIGGKGQDIMFAGVGNDTFQFNADDLLDGSIDIIVNFDAANDLIDLFGASELSNFSGIISEDRDSMAISFNNQKFLDVYFVAPVAGDVDFDFLVSSGVIVA
jgi:hypothetical protein